MANCSQNSLICTALDEMQIGIKRLKKTITRKVAFKIKSQGISIES